jgi:hypothetical protein
MDCFFLDLSSGPDPWTCISVNSALGELSPVYGEAIIVAWAANSDRLLLPNLSNLKAMIGAGVKPAPTKGPPTHWVGAGLIPGRRESTLAVVPL